MTVDELLERAEESLEKGERLGTTDFIKGFALTGIGYVAIALVKMLKEIEDDGRADPEL